MKQLVVASGFVVLWSSGFVGAVLSEPAGSQAGVLSWRYLLTTTVLGLVVLAVRPGRVSVTEVGQQAVMGLLAHVIFLGGVFAAAGSVDAGTTALVCALQPMLVTVAGRAWWRDVVAPRQVAGLLVGLVAVGVTVGGLGSTGLLLALPVLALLGLSGATLLERRWQPRTDVLTGLAIQVVVAAVVFTAYAAATGRLSIAVTGEVVGALVWLTVLSGLGGYACFVLCLRTLGGTTTSLLLYLTPPVTTVWAWLALGQVPVASQGVGLVLGAVAVALAWPRTAAPSAATGDDLSRCAPSATR